jgi:hypothetical protein
MGVLGVNDMQQLEIGVLPLRQLAGEVKDIAAFSDKVRDKQKRASLAVARNRLLIFVNSHGPLLMELGAIAVDVSPTNSSVAGVGAFSAMQIHQPKSTWASKVLCCNLHWFLIDKPT